MKTIICDNPELKIQERIDSFAKDSICALAYNLDTCNLTFKDKSVFQVFDIGNKISSLYSFDKNIYDYNNESIDLCVLGLGYNGQIGLNEVGTQYDSLKHEQKLTSSTIEEFSFIGDIPEFGTTMGIKNICSAKNILLIAKGIIRSKAVFGMLYGRNDSTIPAAFLQIPTNVEIYLDADAASEL